MEVCLELAALMLMLAGGGTLEECRLLRGREALRSGRAKAKLRQMVSAQGGDPSYIDDPARLTPAAVQYELLSPASGYIGAVDAAKVGRASVLLGAGRLTKESPIDHGAGIVIRRPLGGRVGQGEALATCFAATRRFWPRPPARRWTPLRSPRSRFQSLRSSMPGGRRGVCGRITIRQRGLPHGFADLTFLYLFLPANILLYYLTRSQIWRNLVLVAFSLFFLRLGRAGVDHLADLFGHHRLF